MPRSSVMISASRHPDVRRTGARCGRTARCSSMQSTARARWPRARSYHAVGHGDVVRIEVVTPSKSRRRLRADTIEVIRRSARRSAAELSMQFESPRIGADGGARRAAKPLSENFGNRHFRRPAAMPAVPAIPSGPVKPRITLPRDAFRACAAPPSARVAAESHQDLLHCQLPSWTVSVLWRRTVAAGSGEERGIRHLKPLRNACLQPTRANGTSASQIACFGLSSRAAAVMAPWSRYSRSRETPPSGKMLKRTCVTGPKVTSSSR